MSVLYLDHTGHPSPLILTYHATASRHLSSVPFTLHPPPSNATTFPCNTTKSHNNNNNHHSQSVSIELEAAYCPQCLSHHDPYTAHFNMQGRCSTSSSRSPCLACPICQSVVSLHCRDVMEEVDHNNTTMEDSQESREVSSSSRRRFLLRRKQNEGNVKQEQERSSSSSLVGGGCCCYYRCGYCHWESLECDLSIQLSKAESSTTTGMTRAMEELALRYHQTLDENHEQPTKEEFATLCHAWNARATAMQQQQRYKWGAQGVVVMQPPPLYPRPGKEFHGTGGGTMTQLQTLGVDHGKDGTMGVWNMAALEKRIRTSQSRIQEELLKGVLEEDQEEHNDKRKKSTPCQSKAAALQEEKNRLQEVLPRPTSASQVLSSDQQRMTQFGLSPVVPPSFSTTSTMTSTSTKLLLPIPLPLRARKSKRCTLELSRGKPGILMKPKMNPLEGDSSLRTSHGQWWKKDCSAVHVVPTVTIEKHGFFLPSSSSSSSSITTSRMAAILFRVHNPTLGMVRLRFSSSSSASFCNSKQPEKNEESMLVWHQLLLDPFQAKYAHVHVASNLQQQQEEDEEPSLTAKTNPQQEEEESKEDAPAKLITMSEVVELEAAQDALLEMSSSSSSSSAKKGGIGGGGKVEGLSPRQMVDQWTPQTAVASVDDSARASASGDSNDGQANWKSKFRIAAKEHDTAWIEWVTPITTKSSSLSKSNAEDAGECPNAMGVLCTLRIDVKDGSWEASLVPPKKTIHSDEEERDECCFDLLVVLPVEEGKS